MIKNAIYSKNEINKRHFKLKGSKSHLEQIEIMDGDGVVYLTKQNGNVYQFRTWISAENKYYRKSLRTTSRTSAIKKGREIYLQLHTEIATGVKVFGVSVGDLIEKYLEHQQERVNQGFIVKERFAQIQTHMKHYLKHLKKKNIFSSREITSDSALGYLRFRQESVKGIKLMTVRGEQTTIHGFHKFAFENKFIKDSSVRKDEITIKGKELEKKKRDFFTIAEYKKLYRSMRKWVETEVKNTDEENLKYFIQDFILISANTGLRFGELRQLKWKNVEVVDDTTEKGKKVRRVKIFVEADTSKIKRDRRFISRGGEYFDRIKKYSERTGKNDYVFAYSKTGTMLRKNNLYDCWKDLLNDAKLTEIDIEKKLTFYSLRHFAITCRVISGVSYDDCEKIFGTSSTMIKDHYDRMDMTKIKRTLNKTFRVDSEGNYILETE